MTTIENRPCDTGQTRPPQIIGIGPSQVAGHIILATGPALLVLLDTAWSLANGWNLREARGLGVVVVVAAAWTATIMLLAVRRNLPSRCAALTTFSLATAVCLLLGEMAIRLTVPPPAFHARRENVRYDFSPDPRALPGVEGPAAAVYDGGGWRVVAPPPSNGAFRIVCLGGSTTECLYLDAAETWPGRLAQELCAGGVSACVGVAASGTLAAGHHWRYLNDVRGDRVTTADCLVLLAGANDLLRELYRLGNGLARSPWWYRSAWAVTAREVWNGTLGQGLVYDEHGDQLQFLRTAGTVPANVFRSVPSRLDSFRSILLDICQLAKHRSQLVVFVTQPVLWDERLEPEAQQRLWLLSAVERGQRQSISPRTTLRAIRVKMAQYNDVIRDVAADQGVLIVDADQALSGTSSLFYDDVHLNEAGCARLAAIIAERLAPHLRPGPQSEDSLISP